MSLADLFRPPERLSVSEAAEKYVQINQPGAYVGPYKNSMAPYMVEPQDELASRSFEGQIFVGPAQCGKTQSLILNFLAYNCVVDPMDMIIYSPTMFAAKDFSVRRIDRMNRFSPSVGATLMKERDSDNKYEKQYKSGTMLSLGWPTVSQFAGRPVGRLLLTDYDRMPDDIDGDGAAYDLASKRATTFGSFAMTLAESSPSRPITQHNWIATSLHEAPPAAGILALYNRGDRRRLYWPCLHCSHWFEGNFKHLQWDNIGSSMASAKTVRLICPACHHAMYPDDRKTMLEIATWLKDGQFIENGQIFGEPRKSRIASFWLNGVAAAFMSWQKLVESFLDADAEFKKTGSEEALKKHFNNDRGEPYIGKDAQTDRMPEVLKSRAEKLPEREVPVNTRFLVAAIDVQSNMFVVQVFGIQPGAPFDIVVIDRFRIYKSQRKDDDGDTLWIKPGAYLEDWSLITDEVLKKTYPLADGSGRHMQIKDVACDSGGREGVTTNAYNYWRSLKVLGYAGRMHLVKGDGSSGRPRVVISYPDSNRKDRNAGARGDVPVLLFNSTLLKDDLSNRLECQEPGKGMFRTPDWLPDSFYVELCAETRTPKGWRSERRKRNEAWDLAYYCIGLCISTFVKVEFIDWSNPPRWAAQWDTNDFVIQPGEKERFAPQAVPAYDIAKLAKELA